MTEIGVVLAALGAALLVFFFATPPSKAHLAGEAADRRPQWIVAIRLKAFFAGALFLFWGLLRIIVGSLP